MIELGQLSIPRRVRVRGFTLLEVLMASAVLAIVAIGSAAAIVTTPRLMRDADEATSVRAAVHGMVSELTGADFSKVKASFDGTGFAVPGVNAVEGDLDGLPGLIKVETVGTGAATYYKITLSVTWAGINGERTLRSVHYVSNVRGDTDPVNPIPDDAPEPDPIPEGETETLPPEEGKVEVQ